MSVRQKIDGITLGKRYAELVRERDLPVRSLWVQREMSIPVLWIVTQPLQLNELKAIHEPQLVIRKTFPDALFDVRVLNPAWIPDFSEEGQIPPDAQQIELPV